MEVFYTADTDGLVCRLDKEESNHCVRVLRHRCGDVISIIDGKGSMYTCRISEDSPKEVVAEILEKSEGWGGHPYFLHLAVAPTKNTDRYEWFAEKACEVGADRISPVIGEHSERRVLKVQRLEKILLSAAKQSLKGAVPEVTEPEDVKTFIRRHACDKDSPDGKLRLIAYCFENEGCRRISIKEILEDFRGREIIVLIGPEGDFSKDEAELAISCGFVPVHLGTSRLRTETAALTAAECVYFRYM